MVRRLYEVNKVRKTVRLKSVINARRLAYTCTVYIKGTDDRTLSLPCYPALLFPPFPFDDKAKTALIG